MESCATDTPLLNCTITPMPSAYLSGQQSAQLAEVSDIPLRQSGCQVTHMVKAITDQTAAKCPHNPTPPGPPCAQGHQGSSLAGWANIHTSRQQDP